jgi:hypothetical protein
LALWFGTKTYIMLVHTLGFMKLIDFGKVPGVNYCAEPSKETRCTETNMSISQIQVFPDINWHYGLEPKLIYC